MTRFIDTRLNTFELQCIVKSDKNYYIDLKNYLDRYVAHVKSIICLDDECIDNTEHNINLIIEELTLYNNAKVADAKECIKKLLINIVMHHI